MNRLWLGWLGCFLIAAAGVSGYLLVVSASQHGLPVGCGIGSGCKVVLTSRWSTVLGLPVSGLGLLSYLSMFGASCWIHWRPETASYRWAWSLLVLLAYATVLSVAWFIVLQYFILNTVCAYCMAAHAFGLTAAGLVFLRMPRSGLDPKNESSVILVVGRRRLFIAATICVFTFIGVQWFYPGAVSHVARLALGENADTGPGADRVIKVLPGNFKVAVVEQPIIGSHDAPHLLVLMYDYCCLHCRVANTNLRKCRGRYPNQISIVAVPVPLDADCNPAIRSTKARFIDACDLARLALAVWVAEASAFADYDAWLFLEDRPREIPEARRKAEELIGSKRLNTALEDPLVELTIHRNVEAYAQSGAASLPVIVSPGMAAIVGSPRSPRELYRILEKELGLVAP